MFPISLDLSRLPVTLVGNGPQAARRLALLDEDGAENVIVYAPAPTEALARAGDGRLLRRWPTPAEVAQARLLLIADDVEAGVMRDLVATARAGGTLVNVEDRPELCDFHSPAVVRRGDLLLTVSTGGRSPRLAHRLGRFLGEVFGPEWQTTAGGSGGAARPLAGIRGRPHDGQRLDRRLDGPSRAVARRERDQGRGHGCGNISARSPDLRHLPINETKRRNSCL